MNVDSIMKARKEAKTTAPSRHMTASESAASLPQQYHMEVNKGSMNMRSQTQRLNALWSEGWKLHTALEQDGNTVFILERRA